MKITQTFTSLRTDNRLLGRLVKLMFITVVTISLAFGAYYYWDRFVHPGDMSPTELKITHLEEVVQESPEDPAARLTLAQSYLENGDYDAAQGQAQAVLDSDPNNMGALLLLGITHTKSGQPQVAIETLEKFTVLRRAAQMEQTDTFLEAALFYLGQNYLTLNVPDKAIEVLSEAIQIDPTDADAIYLLGNSFALVGNHEKAVEAYQNAVRFVPNFLEAYQGMQSSYTALNDPNRMTYAQGMEAYSTKDYNQARQYLEKAVVALPDFAPVHLGLALTYEQLGEAQLALDSVQRALQLAPHDFAAQNLFERLKSSIQ